VAHRLLFILVAALALSGCTALEQEFRDNQIADGLPLAYDPEVPYFPTPDKAVDAMLKLAGTGASDVVYDLGCGDGRIVIAAAKSFGARAVGIDIDPLPLRMAVSGARQAGVQDRVRFVRGDLFEADIHEATVVTLFLLEHVNRRLLPKLLKELAPGTRIVAYRYNFGDAWPPQKTLQVGESAIYFWTVPGR